MIRDHRAYLFPCYVLARTAGGEHAIFSARAPSWEQLRGWPLSERWSASFCWPFVRRRFGGRGIAMSMMWCPARYLSSNTIRWINLADFAKCWASIERYCWLHPQKWPKITHYGQIGDLSNPCTSMLVSRLGPLKVPEKDSITCI